MYFYFMYFYLHFFINNMNFVRSLDSRVFSHSWKEGENCNPSENHELPKAMRWSYKQGFLKVDELRTILDALTPTGVICRPFEDHREWGPFLELCLYKGFLVWVGKYIPYFPNRCLCQFGFRQYIPSPNSC